MPVLRDYVSVVEAAGVLGTHWETVKRLCRGGRIPEEKVHNKWLIHSFVSTEEAIEAAKKYAARNVEATGNLTIIILDDKKEVASKLEDVKADDLVTRAGKSMKNRRTVRKSNGANLGFEEKLWQAADCCQSAKWDTF